ncbi:MAG: FecR family protein [Natronospirillum sp.]|uniref:FecR family protein n=1 Tax=Natronospirillum sp. TaxID=2812955 RepID=UPI0025EECE3A|nr:FecR family protein [Natronospirillum sp.]MCH8550908.1 FecR family protein [Natronospirillum sp.]
MIPYPAPTPASAATAAAGYRRQLRHWLLVTWLLAALPASTVAEELVGRVVSVVGEVIAIRPDATERRLQRRSDVLVGDTLVTGANGRAQIRFVDDGLLDLRPDSELYIEAYAEATEETPGSAVLEFSRGALRTISGRIGQEAGDRYQMDTAPASIGIRGTDYALQYCAAACIEAGGSEGLYGRVNDGAITVTNLTGTADFESGQFFGVADQNTPALPIPRPPPGVLNGSEGGENGDGEDDDLVGQEDFSEAPDELEDDPSELTLERDLLITPGLDTSGLIGEDDNGDTPEPGNGDDPEPDEPDPSEVTRVMSGLFAYTAYGNTQTVSGLIRESEVSEGNFTLSDSSVTEAFFDDDNSVIVDTDADLVGVGSWTSLDGTSTVDWGRWTSSNKGLFDVVSEGGSINFSGSPNQPDFVFFYSEDLTSPEQLQALDGTVTYDQFQGPDFIISTQNGELDLIEWTMVLTVDFAAIEAGVEMDIVTALISYNVDTAQTSVDSLFLFELPLEGTWTDGTNTEDLEGLLNGQFIGETADGFLFYFTLDQLEDGDVIDTLLGNQLITTEDGPAN